MDENVNCGFHVLYPYKYFIDFFMCKKVVENFLLKANWSCRYQKIVTPYGPTGIMVTPPGFRLILAITVWDVKPLLWTFHIQATFKMLTEEEKITYLSGNLNLLAENIKMMEPIEEYRPRTVTLTWAYSREKEKIVSTCSVPQSVAGNYH